MDDCPRCQKILEGIRKAHNRSQFIYDAIEEKRKQRAAQEELLVRSGPIAQEGS